MPGGICAASSDVGFLASARCSSLDVRFMGLSRQITLGGFAEAYFPTHSNEQLGQLAGGETVEVVWESAVFRGHDRILGDVIARLDPAKAGQLPTSEVKSLSADRFFPASNRNYLPFEIHLPRFGVTLEGDAPIVNSATIDRIPPYGAVYQLDRPVGFRNRGGIRWMAATVEKCSVKLVELKNIEVELRERSSDSALVRFDAKLTNRTTEDRIRVSWMVWPEADGAQDIAGWVWLDRESVSLSIDVPVAVLARQRWLGIAISSPFHTDAAEAVRFPAIQ